MLPPLAASRDSVSPREAYAMLGLAFLGYLAAGMAFEVGWVEAHAGTLAAQALLFILLPAGILAARRVPVAEAFGWRLPPGKTFAATALYGAGVTGLVMLWSLLQGVLMPPPPEYLEQMQTLGRAESFWQGLWVFCIMALTPALCEETFFRGVFFGAMRRRLPPVSAAAWTALVFAAFHFDPYRLVSTGMLGFAYGVLMLRTGSVLPGMLAHALNNSAGLAALWWSGAAWFGFAAGGFILAAPALFVLGDRMLPPMPQTSYPALSPEGPEAAPDGEKPS